MPWVTPLASVRSSLSHANRSHEADEPLWLMTYLSSSGRKRTLSGTLLHLLSLLLVCDGTHAPGQTLSTRIRGRVRLVPPSLAGCNEVQASQGARFHTAQSF